MGLNLNRPSRWVGRFTLEGVPSGQTLRLYAETSDRRFAGSTTFAAPGKGDPASRITVALTPTVAVEKVLEDDGGKPLSSKKFPPLAQGGGGRLPFLRRTVESDAQGRVKFDGIVPAFPTGSRKTFRCVKGRRT
jgi:hypothetical protein